jgi:hypothetical protein
MGQIAFYKVCGIVLLDCHLSSEARIFDDGGIYSSLVIVATSCNRKRCIYGEDMRGEVIVITRQVDVGWTVQDVDQPCQLLDQPQPEIRTMSPELYLCFL